MTRQWVVVASRDHVRVGVAGSFGQACHGARSPMARLKQGDGVVYYSPREHMRSGAPVQSFTAIGEVADETLTQVDMGGGFEPFRRTIHFRPSVEAPIRPLLPLLSFTSGHPAWGYVFRRGLFEIPATDFRLIAEAMAPPQGGSSVPA